MVNGLRLPRTSAWGGLPPRRANPKCLRRSESWPPTSGRGLRRIVFIVPASWRPSRVHLSFLPRLGPGAGFLRGSQGFQLRLDFARLPLEDAGLQQIFYPQRDFGVINRLAEKIGAPAFRAWRRISEVLSPVNTSTGRNSPAGSDSAIASTRQTRPPLACAKSSTTRSG